VVAGPIVVLGAAGQLGADLVHALGDRAVPRTHADVDVRDRAGLAAAIPAGAAWVVNTAAFHNVDACEDDAEQAFAVNALGARHVALAAAAAGAGVVFFSSDYVFDGTAGVPYREHDAPNPLNVYGASKLAGETLTRLANPRALIVRTAYLFGHQRSGKGWNLITGIVEQARRGQELRAAHDLVLSPTFTAHLAARVVELVDAGVTGTVHLAGGGACARDELTRFVLAAAGLEAPVKSISAAELPWRARRPLRSPLASAVLPGLGMRPLPDWRSAVREFLAQRRAS
jgi:dTDP-4-dehydrorhamnose reductase